MPKPQKKSSGNSSSDGNNDLSNDKLLKELITATTKLWRKYHLNYDQVRYV